MDCPKCGREVNEFFDIPTTAELEHLADAIATGENLKALQMMRDLFPGDIRPPHQVVQSCKNRGWDVIDLESGASNVKTAS